MRSRHRRDLDVHDFPSAIPAQEGIRKAEVLHEWLGGRDSNSETCFSKLVMACDFWF
jgi:hypothetical protein